MGLVALLLLLLWAGMSFLQRGMDVDDDDRTLTPQQLEEACDEGQPYVAVTCSSWVAVFRPDELRPKRFVYGLSRRATDSLIGAVWGMAYSPQEHALYVAASHRRGEEFGPGGPGAVYRIDLGSAQVEAAFEVPDPGADHHQPDARLGDDTARDPAGKTSLGDVELSADGRHLFVVNAFDRKIHAFDTVLKDWVRSDPVGGLDESWAEDARPWGLG